MPRTAEQNDKIKEERSKDILAASLVLFSSRGFNNVSVDLITETVNCSHGLFYHYFKSVDDIFVKIVDSTEKFNFQKFSIVEILNQDGFDGLKMIADYFGSEKTYNDAFLCYAKIVLTEINIKPLNNHFKNRYGFENLIDGLSRLIVTAQKDGKVVDGDPHEIAEAIRLFLLSYVNKLSGQKKKDRKFIPAETLLKFICK